jgi:glucosamine--fructose-6-phosphate aminotransferase (isomerizing)
MRQLPAQIELVLESQERYIEDLAHSFGDTQDFIYLGRGINFPIALEGALKLKEISYIHAEGYPAGEMKHGPIALLDAKVPSGGDRHARGPSTTRCFPTPRKPRHGMLN